MRTTKAERRALREDGAVYWVKGHCWIRLQPDQLLGTQTQYDTIEKAVHRVADRGGVITFLWKPITDSQERVEAGKYLLLKGKRYLRVMS